MTPSGGRQVVEAASGDRVMDLADDLDAPIAFSCRSASCGICRVRVEEGLRLLQPPSEHECEVLEALGSSGVERLACQAKIRAATGIIRLRTG